MLPRLITLGLITVVGLYFSWYGSPEIKLYIIFPALILGGVISYNTNPSIQFRRYLDNVRAMHEKQARLERVWHGLESPRTTEERYVAGMVIYLPQFDSSYVDNRAFATYIYNLWRPLNDEIGDTEYWRIVALPKKIELVQVETLGEKDPSPTSVFRVNKSVPIDSQQVKSPIGGVGEGLRAVLGDNIDDGWEGRKSKKRVFDLKI